MIVFDTSGLIILCLLSLIPIVRSTPLSSSSQEGEEEALKLWQKFCAGSSDEDKSLNGGGLFVFCAPTPLNEEIPEIDLRLNHDIKVSEKEKHIETIEEIPQQSIPAEIPRARSASRNRTRSRGGGAWRTRFYYARKNTIESKTKDGEQFSHNLHSILETTTETIAKISTSSSKIETQTLPKVEQKSSTVSGIQRGRKKEERDPNKRVLRRRGRGRVAIVDVKPVSLLVNNANATSETTGSNS